MHKWMSEEIFKRWSEAQEQFWQQWTGAAPVDADKALEAWRQACSQNMGLWEKLVRETLEGQAAWVEQCMVRMGGEGKNIEALGEWRQRFDAGMRQWMEAQTQLWEQLFEVMHSAAQTEVKESAPPEQVVASSPVVTEEVAPPVVEPVAAEPVVAETTAPAMDMDVQEPVAAPPEEIQVAEQDNESPVPMTASADIPEPTTASDIEPVSKPRTRRRVNKPLE